MNNLLFVMNCQAFDTNGIVSLRRGGSRSLSFPFGLSANKSSTKTAGRSITGPKEPMILADNSIDCFSIQTVVLLSPDIKIYLKFS